MNPIAVTNNSLIYEIISDKKIFSEIILDAGCSVMDILKISKGMIIKGHRLLTNPLYGNIPPYEMPFKTIVLSSEKYGAIDFASLGIINESLTKTKKSIEERTKAGWNKSDLADFKKNDLLIIERWLFKIYLPNKDKVRSVGDGN